MELIQQCEQAGLTVKLDGRNLRIGGDGLATDAGRGLVVELKRNKGAVVDYLTKKARLNELVNLRHGFMFDDEVAEAQAIADELGIDMGWKRGYFKLGESVKWESWTPGR